LVIDGYKQFDNMYIEVKKEDNNGTAVPTRDEQTIGADCI